MRTIVITFLCYLLSSLMSGTLDVNEHNEVAMLISIALWFICIGATDKTETTENGR